MSVLQNSTICPVHDHEKPAPSRLHVHLSGLERIAPPGRHDTEVRSWLQAPLLGAPLVRRMLEPLLGLPVHALIPGDSRGGRLLSTVLHSGPRFGIGTASDTTGPLSPGTPRRHLHLPADGLLLDGLESILRRGVGLRRQEASNDLRVRNRPLFLTDSVTPPDLTAPCGSIRTLPFCSPRELLETTDALLARDVSDLRPIGRWADGVLRGPRCRIARRTSLSGRVAIGEESLIESDVTLGPGTSIGRRCVIGRGARIEHSVILDGVLVAPSETLSGVVRGPQGDILV